MYNHSRERSRRRDDHADVMDGIGLFQESLVPDIMVRLADSSATKKALGIRLIAQRVGLLAQQDIRQEVDSMVRSLREVLVRPQYDELRDDAMTALCCLAVLQGRAFAGSARMILNDMMPGIDRLAGKGQGAQCYALGFIVAFSRLDEEEVAPVVDALARAAEHDGAEGSCVRGVGILCAVQPTEFTLGERIGYDALVSVITAAFASPDGEAVLAGLDALELLWGYLDGEEALQIEIRERFIAEMGSLHTGVSGRMEAKAVKRRVQALRRVLDGDEDPRLVTLQLLEQEVTFETVRKLTILEALRELARDGLLQVLEGCREVWGLLEYVLKPRKVAVREKFADRVAAREQRATASKLRGKDLKEKRRAAAVREEEQPWD